MRKTFWLIPLLCLGLIVSAKIWPMPKNDINWPSDFGEMDKVVEPIPIPSREHVDRKFLQDVQIFRKSDLPDPTPSPSLLEEDHSYEDMDFRFIGLISTGNQKTAYFENLNDGTVSKIKAGENIGDWTLKTVSGSAAKLTRNNETERLELYAIQR